MTIAAWLVFAKCVSVDGTLSAEVLAHARRYLAEEPDVNHWLFGYWNVSYLKWHGPRVNEHNPPALVPSSDADMQRCTSDPAYQQLELLTEDVSPSDSTMSGLFDWYARAYSRTLTQPAFVRMTKSVVACVEKAGWKAAPVSEFGGVAIQADWSRERRFRAYVAEAKCRDRLHYTVKVAALAAAENVAMISKHRQELDRIRTEAVKRVTQADAVLRDAGLL